MFGEVPGTAAFVLTILGALLLPGLVIAARRGIRSTRRGVAADCVAAMSPAAVSAAAAAAGWPQFAWAPPLVLSVAIALVLVCRSSPVRRLYAATSPRKRVAVVIGAGALAIGVWWAGQAGPAPLQSAPRVGVTPEEAEAALDSVQEVSSPIALTDRGRRIRLYAMPESAIPSPTLAAMEAGTTEEWGPTLKVIRTGHPDRRADCHGWVFADGEWWILGRDVHLVLKDNGYRPVTDPAAGDLVIYRDFQGEITHSGLVWTVARSGALLIESKWAWLGTYLHAPDDHPYGGTPVYYRSTRAGHRLNLVQAGNSPRGPAAPAPASPGQDSRSR